MKKKLSLKKVQQVHLLFKCEVLLGMLALVATLAYSGNAYKSSPYNIGIGISLVVFISGFMHFFEFKQD
jgi:hypothetical protein